MGCTTLLVGRKASYDGSTMIARNDDSGAGSFEAKKFTVVHPEEQPKVYQSVLSHVTIELPEHPMRYTAMPNADDHKGIWASAGVNEENISMTATETLTTNARVLGGDPLVKGGIGEEDICVLVLPYIHSAREGVQRLGSLLEQYGTYEMNGIAFQEAKEIWWLETIGGHHWIARRVPDDCYVVMPNQFGIDDFDLEDAFGEQKEYMCSADLREFIAENHLDLSLNGKFNARSAFGSHTDFDHSYNTPRAWFIQRYLNPSEKWDGPDAPYRPESDDIPWCRVPEKKITIEDAKYTLSAHYQGTAFDPYGKYGESNRRGAYRPIGINRTNFLSLVQLRPDVPAEISAVEWIAYACNAFNAFVPFYANVETTPAYLKDATADATTENFYWANRVISVIADAHYDSCIAWIERYQMSVSSKAYGIMQKYDRIYAETKNRKVLETANEEIADMLKKETQSLLNHVLYEASCRMKNIFSRSDA